MKSLSSFKKIILGISIILGGGMYIYLFATTYITRYLEGTWWSPHTMGVFLSNDGNPWIIEFSKAPTNSWTYPWASLISHESGHTLTGYFWIGTIGWASFENVDFSQSWVNPASIDPYYLSGWAWSDYAGWIDFSETGKVIWEPSTGSFSGYAWNDGIGWINMLGASIENTSSGLIGKVKIIGQAWGQFFDTTYSIKDISIQGKMMNPIINAVRKNVAILLRNLPDTKMNTNFSVSTPNTYQSTVIFAYTGMSPVHVSYDKQGIDTLFDDIVNPTKSLVVVGGDVYIDKNIISWWVSWDHPKSIIVLKNTQWVGGDVYIDGNVTKLMSSIVAEWSLFSWYYSWTSQTPTLYNKTASGLLLLPSGQLYIYGSAISHNTIWGAYGQGVGNYVCPFTEMSCTKSVAIRYDFNYFRDFQKTSPLANSLRGYKNNSYDDYSIVIEYDPRVQSMPPPGLETLK